MSAQEKKEAMVETFPRLLAVVAPSLAISVPSSAPSPSPASVHVTSSTGQPNASMTHRTLTEKCVVVQALDVGKLVDAARDFHVVGARFRRLRGVGGDDKIAACCALCVGGQAAYTDIVGRAGGLLNDAFLFNGSLARRGGLCWVGNSFRGGVRH